MLTKGLQIFILWLRLRIPYNNRADETNQKMTEIFLAQEEIWKLSLRILGIPKGEAC